MRLSGTFNSIRDASEAAIYQIASERLASFSNRTTRSRSITDLCSFLTSPGVLEHPSLVIRCRLEAGEIRIDKIVDKKISRWRLTECFHPFIQRILPRFGGSVDFLVLLSDNLYPSPAAIQEFSERLEDAPLFRSDWKPKHWSERAIPIPDFHIQQPSYAAALERIGRVRAKLSFRQRRPVIGWRGSLSGPVHATMQTVMSFPRYKLLNLARQVPDLVDAKLTNFDDIELRDWDGAIRALLLNQFGALAPHLPEEQFVAYRYLVSADGAVAAWRRVPTILASGSVLLLQNEWCQFFYPGLQAWRHYLPVADDFSNLLGLRTWLDEHPGEAFEIGEAGRRFAEASLTPAAIEEYFLFVINALAS